ncbi:MAG: hypothetical protein GSR85_11050 [Desulfurococcales archaeon]|nr:hypothetical protein [Desulfurococcales archaeon]
MENEYSLASVRIRLRYSTLVNASVAAYRIGVAILFMIILARKLTISEFGVWGVIFASAQTLTVPVNLWSWWAQRYYARGHVYSLATGLALTGVYWLISVIIYVGLSYIEASILNVSLYYFMIAVPLLPLLTARAYLRSLLSVVKPEAIGYSNFIYETIRLILVYILLVEMRWGLIGAIFTLEVSTLVTVIYMVFALVRIDKASRLRVDRGLLGEWLKGFYIPLLNVVASSMRSGVRPFISWYYRDEAPVSYLNTGLASSNPITGVTQSLVPALYARLLRGTRDSRDVEESLRLYMLFTGFMLVTLVLLSRPIASLYSLRYVDAYPIIAIMALYASLISLANIFIQVVQGVDRIDVYGIRSPSILLKSLLFKGSLVRVASIALSYLGIILLSYTLGDANPLESAINVSISLLLGAIVFLVLSLSLAGHTVKYMFPFKTLMQVAVASIITGLYYRILGVHEYIVYKFWEDAPILIAYIILGGVVYVSSLYPLSGWFRGLLKAIINNLLHKK